MPVLSAHTIKKSIIIFVLSAFVLTLSSCGYLPSSKEARKVLGETVSTKVVISMTDPENTVVIKDALDEAVIQRFQTNLRHEKEASTHLVIQLRSVGFRALQYDNNGYIISYRTTINLSVVRSTQNFTKTYRAVGNYDFAIDPNAIITDQQRFEAIEKSALKALDSFVAQVAAEGSRKQ